MLGLVLVKLKTVDRKSVRVRESSETQNVSLPRKRQHPRQPPAVAGREIRAPAEPVQGAVQRHEPPRRVARGEPVQALQASSKQLLHTHQEPLHLLRPRPRRLRDLPYVSYRLPRSRLQGHAQRRQESVLVVPKRLWLWKLAKDICCCAIFRSS